MPVRKRIGLLVPSTNTTCEPDFYRTISVETTVHTHRLWLTNDSGDADAVDRMNAEVEQGARYLKTANVDVVVYGCTTGSFYKGPGYDSEMLELIEAASGVPAVATSPAAAEALRSVGAKKISVATPYPDWNNGNSAPTMKNPASRYSMWTASRWRPKPAPRVSMINTPTPCSSSLRAYASQRPTPFSVSVRHGDLSRWCESLSSGWVAR